MPAPQPDVSLQLIFDTMVAYQRGAALRAAIELDFFTAIAPGHDTAAAPAAHGHPAERGARILADTLTAFGLLTKEGRRYALTPDAAAFLNRNSPAYVGTAVEFLQSPTLVEAFEQLTAAVRKGG